MTLVTDIKTRIESNVPTLAGRLEEVADLAALIAAGALPQRSPAGYVIPLGFNGRPPADAAGLFIQSLDKSVGLVLVVQAPGDPKARRALATIDDLEADVLNAVCGFVPAGAIGELHATRGRLVSVDAGTVFYQIDFAIQSQLRITAS
jgi:hypothetical protein